MYHKSCVFDCPPTIYLLIIGECVLNGYIYIGCSVAFEDRQQKQ